jgi:hypothetical protein
MIHNKANESYDRIIHKHFDMKDVIKWIFQPINDVLLWITDSLLKSYVLLFDKIRAQLIFTVREFLEVLKTLESF